MTHPSWGPGAAGTLEANNTCFFQGKEFLFGCAVFLRVQPLRAGGGGGATCVDAMCNAVEQLGRGGSGTQQRREFLEQLLNLWWESCSRGLGTPGSNKRGGTCLGEGAARGRVQDLLFGWDY
jgi:hypothetical protein